jgi:hypothetical protein
VALQTVPFALQNASHGANLFRQSASAVFTQGGILAAGELFVSAQASPNMTVKVSPGRAKVTGTSASAPSGVTWTTQAMYDVLNDASTNITISAADATNPRIDLVYIQVQDDFYTGSAHQAVMTVATGTPAASPATPATPVNSIALATVRVNAGVTSITNSNITNLATQATIIGQVKVFQTLAALSALTGMAANDLAAVVADSTATNNTFYYYTGSVWSQIIGKTFDASAIVSGTLSTSRLPTVPVANGGTGATTLTGYVIGNGSSAMTGQTGVPATDITGTLPITKGGTGITTMTSGFLKYNGSAVTSGNGVAASDISSAEQANIVSGKIRAGGTTGGSSTTIFIQSSTPTANAAGDLWFW